MGAIEVDELKVIVLFIVPIVVIIYAFSHITSHSTYTSDQW